MILTIIIPMYNAADFLVKCVSHINITDIDYEILMINDGSPDDSLSIANEIAASNPSVKVFSQDNKGLGGARNLGILNSNSKYILFLDADDILIHQNFSFLKNEISDIVEFSFKRVSTENNITMSYNVDHLSKSISGIDYYLTNKTVNSACNKIYRREFLQSNNLLFKERIYAEDFEFNTRAFYLASCVISYNQILQHFLDSPNSITRNKNIEQKRKIVKDYTLIGESLNRFKNKVRNQEKSTAYFNKKFTFLTVALIYQSLKNRLGLALLKKNIDSLKAHNAFCLDAHITPFPKNLLRIGLRLLYR